MNDILKRDSFKNVKVISGKMGLNNAVKWTHIIESEKFINYLNGGELILTTGIGLDSEPYANISFIEQLIKKNVAAICIELGNKFRDISPEIIKLSNEKNTPIITFPNIVKFVDITQDIHRLMVNNHYQILNSLYTLSKKFNALSLLPNGILKILEELHNYFKTPAFYIQPGSSSVYYPPHAKSIERKMIDYIHEHGLKDHYIQIEDNNFICSKVENTSRTPGYLFLQLTQEGSSDFLHTVLDHAGLAVSQITLRNEMAEERKQYTEVEVVQGFLHDRFHDYNRLDSLLPFSYKSSFFRVIVFIMNEINDEIWHEWNETKLRITLTIRGIFKRYNLFPLISVRENEISIISFMISRNKASDNKAKYEKALKLITEDEELQKLLNNEYYVGIGKNYNSVSEISQSYIEAKRVIELRQSNIASDLFYEDIGIYEILFQLQNRQQLESFIQSHLGRILQLEPKARLELLTTLEVFLDHNGSYKESSQKLFVVRQTLYHRINKLQDLLGKDFLSSPNRLALEFSVKAYRYFSSIDNLYT
ncbi:PucR family transcriptional regulator [Siminovitchia acidinfaciens]|uniref:PucR family transcriptional regulator n=1 Tax=Siminovitchia acidinfaciens TaxID=2321395 RepID=A0A429Y760_9BACI|nr:PucR family transcriptional regulator [Siminovitchia acidinfaciens]